MHRHLLGRRQFLRGSTRALTSLGVAPKILGLWDALFPARAAAEALAPETIYRATGFFEKTALGHETLVAVVLVPLNGAAPPSIDIGTGLEGRDLGTGLLETYQGRMNGMERKLLLHQGAIQAVVYSVKSPEGSYAEEKRYLFGRIELGLENPRARAERRDGGVNGERGGKGSM